MVDRLLQGHSIGQAGRLCQIGEERVEKRRTRRIRQRVLPRIGHVLGQEPEHLLGIRPVDERHSPGTYDVTAFASTSSRVNHAGLNSRSE